MQIKGNTAFKHYDHAKTFTKEIDIFIGHFLHILKSEFISLIRNSVISKLYLNVYTSMR